MKKIILIGIGIIIFLGIVGSSANKTTEKVTISSTTASNTPTTIINEPTVTASPYMSKEVYGRGVIGVSKKQSKLEVLSVLLLH